MRRRFTGQIFSISRRKRRVSSFRFVEPAAAKSAVSSWSFHVRASSQITEKTAIAGDRFRSFRRNKNRRSSFTSDSFVSPSGDDGDLGGEFARSLRPPFVYIGYFSLTQVSKRRTVFVFRIAR